MNTIADPQPRQKKDTLPVGQRKKSEKEKELKEKTDRQRECLRLKSLLFENCVFTAGLPVGFRRLFMYNSVQRAEINPPIKGSAL